MHTVPSGCGRTDLYLRAGWRRVPGGSQLEGGRGWGPLVLESGPVEVLHLRPRPHTEPVTNHITSSEQNE